MFDEAMAWWYHAASFLYIAGLVFALGAAAAPLVLGASLRRAVPALLPAALLLVAGVAARLVAQVQMAFGEVGGITAESLQIVVFEIPWGWGWRWQAGTAAAVLVAAAVRAPSLVAVAAALAATAAAALTGHAVAFPELVWLMVPIHAAHVAGAGLWMGTLAALLLTVGRLMRVVPDPAERRQAIAGAVARFSTLALGAVAVMTLSGLMAAGYHLGSWDRLAGTSYGRALLLKVGVFLLAGACGAYNWRRVIPGLRSDSGATDRLRRVGTLEVALGVAVLVVTSLLAALPMPAEDVGVGE